MQSGETPKGRWRGRGLREGRGELAVGRRGRSLREHRGRGRREEGDRRRCGGGREQARRGRRLLRPWQAAASPHWGEGGMCAWGWPGIRALTRLFLRMCLLLMCLSLMMCLWAMPLGTPTCKGPGPHPTTAPSAFQGPHPHQALSHSLAHVPTGSCSQVFPAGPFPTASQARPLLLRFLLRTSAISYTLCPLPGPLPFSMQQTHLLFAQMPAHSSPHKTHATMQGSPAVLHPVSPLLALSGLPPTSPCPRPCPYYLYDR